MSYRSAGCKSERKRRAVARRQLREKYGVQTDFEATMLWLADFKKAVAAMKKGA
jgi:hypothetical protein